MKLYLSARYSKRERMNAAAVHLKANAHEIVSRWHRYDVDHGWDHESISKAQAIGEEDLHDLMAADSLLFFNDEVDSEGRRGGRHFEMGAAYAAGLLIVVIGRRTNPFMYRPDIMHVPDLVTAIEWLAAYESESLHRCVECGQQKRVRPASRPARGVAALLSTTNDRTDADMLKDPNAGQLTLAPQASGTSEKV